MGTKHIQQVGGALEFRGNLCWPDDPSLSNGGTMYLQPPAAADPFDDEFLDGSPDLAARGWTVVNVTTGAPVTRAGDVDFRTIPGAGTTGKYFSTLTASGLVLQCFDIIAISKAVADVSSGLFAIVQAGTPQQSTTTFEAGAWIWQNFPGSRLAAQRAVLTAKQQQGVIRAQMGLGTTFPVAGGVGTTESQLGLWSSFIKGSPGAHEWAIIQSPEATQQILSASVHNGDALANGMAACGAMGVELFTQGTGLPVLQAQFAIVRCVRRLAAGVWPAN